MDSMTTKHKTSIEKLVHFQCSDCNKWWTIGDAPDDKKEWYCPWCGTKNETNEIPTNENNVTV